ncbi:MULTISPECIES: nuclear transport factor 2 family protein [unclassified Pseudoalteromonas]|uniref:nuclear transport factor 2 family protein n=1 Tax=unclassified Pseudoalteromonas TaxID=194690 RepID=UPI0020969D12|nr:nuclear transport factor 2 family protein [Pseudoalteromonas sp. XMcav2-N]MCO7188884.1 nuclear transport factor 2 family protein [Pseudoalteromonas sp. XMcav2-N]
MKLFSITMAAFALLFSSFSRSEAITGEEYQAVVDTAYMYFNGAAKGDQDMLAKAFDQEFGHVKMIRVDSETKEETIRTVPLKEFSGYFKKATKDKWEADILSVDIVDNKMAIVKMDFHTPKTHYIDYLVMYKREGAWRIVTKTFVAKSK